MKKTLLSVLIAAMLLSVFAACAGSETPKDQTAESVTETAASPAESTAAGGSLYDDLPSGLNFDGKNFRILTFAGGNNGTGWRAYFDIDEPKAGDLLETAAYTRNSEIEERFGCEISCIDDVFWWQGNNDGVAYFDRVIGGAGEDAFDAAMLETSTSYEILVIDEILYDLNDLSYIDWNKPYYNQSMDDLYQLGTKRFLMFSNLTYSCQSTPAVLVNNDILVDRGYEADYLYNKVDNHEWTLDTLFEMVQGVYQDLNQNGQHDLEDFYGYASTPYGPVYFYPGAGLEGTYLTDSGFAFDFGTDKASTVVDRILDFVEEDDVFRKEWDFAPFMSGNALFTTWASEMYGLRDWTVNYGVLPQPMFDDTQDTYYDVVSGGALLVPITITDPEFVGAMIEAMSSGSARLMLPAFYENFMQQKILLDDASRRNWERMMSEWSVGEFVRCFCPDSRLNNWGVAKDCITSDFRSFKQSWDKQETSLDNSCREFYKMFMVD